MRAPLSIVIPTLNAATELPETLACLMEGLQAGLVRELIVSDGGSRDATRAIAEDVGALWVAGAPSRGGQLRRGVAASGGTWILLLHADTHLSPGWSDAVRDAMARGAGADGRAHYFRLRFRHGSAGAWWVARWANARARIFGLPYGDQALLLPAELLAQVGGVPDQVLMEDVALARALAGRLAPLDVTAATSFERYAREGTLRRGGRNLGILLRYLAGARPEDLLSRYRRR